MLRNRKLLTIGFTLLLALGGGALMAQEGGDEFEGNDPAELFKSAKESFDGKKYGKALADLNLLVTMAGKLRVKQLQAALPPAPSGWTAEEDTGNSGQSLAFLGGGTTVKRTYRKGGNEDGNAPDVQIEVMADSPMVGAVAPFLTNPALVQSNPNMQLLKLKGKQWLLEFNKENKSGKVSCLLNANTTLVTLTGNNVERADLVDAFAKALDTAALEKALQE